MSTLSIQNLAVVVGEQQILKGVDLEISSGQVHAVMGPNGAGKSTLSNVIMGKPGYQITSGSIELDGRDLSSLPTWERAQAGLFLAMQYPTEVPGVSVRETLELALRAKRPCEGAIVGGGTRGFTQATSQPGVMWLVMWRIPVL